MKRVILLAACAVALGALAWLLFTSSPAPKLDSPAEAPVAEALGSNAAQSVALGEELALPVAPDEGVQAGERVAAPAPSAIDPETAITVTGRIDAAAACNAEDDLEVFAVANALDGQDLADDLVRKSNEGKPPKYLLARARVNANGSFEIALAGETKRAHLLALGRYQYTDESIEIDLEAGTRTASLRVLPGTWVRGRIDVPEGADATELEGMQINFGTTGEGMSGVAGSMRGFDRIANVTAGAFELRAVPCGLPARTIVRPAKLAAALVPAGKLAVCGATNVKVTLVHGATVRGVVRGEAKQPLADVTVQAAVQGQWFGLDDREVRSVKSDAEGRFELTAVTPGNVRLKAKLDGMLDSEPLKLALANGEQRDGVEIVLPTGASIAGNVTFADGKPASGVRVELAFDQSQMYGMNAFNAFRGAKGSDDADAEGRFEIHGLGVGPFTVTAETMPPGLEVEDPKQKQKTLLRARVDGVKPGGKELALVLRPPEGLTGRVIDETGAPVSKFDLALVRPSQGPMGSFGLEHHEESFESESGSFLFAGLEPGEWDVYATAEGFAYPEPVRVTLPHTATGDGFVVTIVHASSVRGVVRTPSGEPFAGAVVKVDTGGPAWMDRVSVAPARPEAKSEADGSFLLGGLASGKIAIRAQGKDFARSLPLAVDLTPAQELADVELVLRTGGTLTGEVYDEQGKPDVGLFVQAHEMSFADQQMSTTDGEGRFRFEHMEPATWQVVAMPLSRSEETTEESGASSPTDDVMALVSKLRQTMVDIQDGVETHVVLGAPPANPVKIKGRVTHHGDAFHPALVSFFREGKDALAAMKHTSVKTDGTFEITLDQAGYYSISVQRVSGEMFQQTLVEFTRDIPEEKEVSVLLEMPTARISGRVRGPGGDPAPGVRVSLHPQAALSGGALWGGHYNELTTDDEGAFDIQALRPGSYTLLVGGMSLGGMFGDDAALGREIRAGLKLSEGEWMRDADFRLKKPGTLETTVVDDAGAPVAGASIFVRSESGEPVDRFSMVTTDNRGIASYGGLTPGKYTISARKDLLASAESASVRIDEGTKQQVALRLGGGTILIISLVGTDDKPVQASLSVQDDQGRELAGMISLSEVMKLFSTGGFTANEKRIGPIPAGRYRVFGSTDDGKTINKNITLNGQPERRVILRFGE